MNVNAPIFIVNVTCGGRRVQSSSPIVLVVLASVVRWRGWHAQPSYGRLEEPNPMRTDESNNSDKTNKASSGLS
ncbi:hypothetical protein CRG98_020281 [Punica granatum]|uniref:Uncharacterized protein n=1 Tax=Punica granatum TaxID=22663 RepID=A0A2I0JV39_PUNGR|nr:hypothetical protein CRG98_020281 [Punica granatum]